MEDFNTKTVDELIPEYMNTEPLEYEKPRKKVEERKKGANDLSPNEI